MWWRAAGRGPTVDEPDEEELPHPWGFWLIVTLAVLYLGWRLMQGVVWLFERITG